jgi:hypothetical protein
MLNISPNFNTASFFDKKKNHTTPAKMSENFRRVGVKGLQEDLSNDITFDSRKKLDGHSL